MIYFRFFDTLCGKGNPPEENRLVKSVINIIVSFLKRLFGSTNADYPFEDIYAWYIEFDDNQGCAVREVAVDKSDYPVGKAPSGKNWGYWTDNTLNLSDYLKFNPQEISRETFESKWNEFEGQGD